MAMVNFTARILTSLCGCSLSLLTLMSCSVAEDERCSDSRRCAGYRDHSAGNSIQRYDRDREDLISRDKALMNAVQAREPAHAP